MSPSPSEFGRYRIIRRIGVGGMGEVFEAELRAAEGFSKRVALKLLLPHLQEDPGTLQSFIDEANLAVKLSHPNIVDVYDFGEAEGTHYLAMEFLEGLDLRRLLGKLGRRRVPVPAAAHIIREVALALSYIHGRVPPIIHRDVSPHNIFCTAHGQVVLGDFGVAKSDSRVSHTEVGIIKGKLHYLAPEQATGDPVSARTDLYALGLVLFELLTGRRLNQGGAEADTIRRAQHPAVVRPSSVNLEAQPLDELTLRLLERHPAARLPSADLAVEALARYLAKHPFDALALKTWIATLSDEQTDDAPTIQARPKRPLEDAETEAAVTGSLLPDPDSEATALKTVRFQPPADRPAPAGTSSLPWRGELARRRRRWRQAAIAGAALLLLGAAGVVALRPAPSSAPRPAAPGDSAPAAPDHRAARREAGPEQTAGAAPSERPDARLPALDAGLSVVRVRTPPRSRARPTAPQPRATAIKLDSARARERLRLALQQARRRGLHPGDDASFDRLCGAVRGVIARGEPAELELAQVEQAAAGFRIDRAFATRKLDRLDRMIAATKLADADKQRITQDSQRILQLILAERLVEASELISTVSSQLRALGSSQGGTSP